MPDPAVIAADPTGLHADGSATTSAASQSIGFTTDVFGNADVSGEWGATVGGEADPGIGSHYDYVSVMPAHTAPFPGLNVDGPLTSLGGPQGGLLGDSAARGSHGVIDNSVILTVALDADPLTIGNQALSTALQSAFLAGVACSSIVEYGSSSAFGVVIPLSTGATMGMVLLGGIGIAAALRRLRRAV